MSIKKKENIFKKKKENKETKIVLKTGQKYYLHK